MTNLGRRLRELLLWAGAALGLLAVTVGVLVAFFGFNLLVFRSGSMSPEIPTGGIALSQTVQAADVKPGDVVSVIAGNGERITHRVVSTTLRGDEASLVLKGDANATPDSQLYVVTSVDRVQASLPYGGYLIVHALTPPGILAVACLSLMLLLISGGRDEDEWGDDEDDELDGDDGDDEAEAGEDVDRHRGRNPFRRRVAAAGAAFAVLVGGALAAGHVSGTLAFFTDRATVTSGTYTSNKFFDCDSFARGAGNPYLYWKVDEAGYGLGTPADASGNGRTGQYSLTGVTYSQARACADDTGTAITLNGSAGAIGAPVARTAIAGPSTFSLSMWFKTTTTRGGKLIGFGNQQTAVSNQYDRHIYMQNDGKLVFGVYPNAVRVVTSPLAYNDNTWHQVVATLSGAGMRLYVDGALVANRTDTTTAESYNGYWRVGFDNLDAWENVPTSRYFAGTVDEVAVYTTALSDTDIAAGRRAG